jgi:isocitrate/isopropylmalate dehydrogenase
VFSAGQQLTPDLGGQATTAQMAEAIAAALAG